jgi:hypothetical protein
MEIKITGCDNCPCCIMNYDHEEDGYFCSLFFHARITRQKNIIKEDGDLANPITPDWCPLKNENVTIGY